MPRAEWRNWNQSRTRLKKNINCKERAKVKSVQLQSWALSLILEVDAICRPSRESERGRTGQEAGSDRHPGNRRGRASFAHVWCSTFPPQPSSSRSVNTFFCTVRAFQLFTKFISAIPFPLLSSCGRNVLSADSNAVYFQHLLQHMV